MLRNPKSTSNAYELRVGYSFGVSLAPTHESKNLKNPQMMAMASTTASAATFLSSPRSTKSAIYNPTSYSHPKNQRLHLSAVFPQLGLSPFSPWSGLKHLGVSFRPKSSKLGTLCDLGLMYCYAALFSDFSSFVIWWCREEGKV